MRRDVTQTVTDPSAPRGGPTSGSGGGGGGDSWGPPTVISVSTVEASMQVTAQRVVSTHVELVVTAGWDMPLFYFEVTRLEMGSEERVDMAVGLHVSSTSAMTLSTSHTFDARPWFGRVRGATFWLFGVLPVWIKFGGYIQPELSITAALGTGMSGFSAQWGSAFTPYRMPLGLTYANGRYTLYNPQPNAAPPVVGPAAPPKVSVFQLNALPATLTLVSGAHG